MKEKLYQKVIKNDFLISAFSFVCFFWLFYGGYKGDFPFSLSNKDTVISRKVIR